MLELTQAVVAREQTARGPLTIDGVAVDALFEEIWRAIRKTADAVGAKVRMEVIAWEPLIAAADRNALFETLRDLMQDALTASPGGNVALRAFPSHEDVCVTFQVVIERAGPTLRELLSESGDLVDRACASIQRMGGEWSMHPLEHRGVCVWFSLPQWVTCEMGPAGLWQKAA